MAPMMLRPEQPDYGGELRLSVESLCNLMPRLGEALARQFILPLTNAMQEFGITTPARQAAFLAQLAHESVQLTHWIEDPHSRPVSWCSLCLSTGKGHAAGVQYEGKKRLGNTQPGDGVRFVGRGPIQLTGRSNYEAAAAALGVDLARSPDLAASPAVGFRIAGWFWASRDLNAVADRGDFREITRRINGGFNGLPERERYWAKAKELLGVA